MIDHDMKMFMLNNAKTHSERFTGAETQKHSLRAMHLSVQSAMMPKLGAKRENYSETRRVLAECTKDEYRLLGSSVFLHMQTPPSNIPPDYNDKVENNKYWQNKQGGGPDRPFYSNASSYTANIFIIGEHGKRATFTISQSGSSGCIQGKKRKREADDFKSEDVPIKLEDVNEHTMPDSDSEVELVVTVRVSKKRLRFLAEQEGMIDMESAMKLSEEFNVEQRHRHRLTTQLAQLKTSANADWSSQEKALHVLNIVRVCTDEDQLHGVNLLISRATVQMDREWVDELDTDTQCKREIGVAGDYLCELISGMTQAVEAYVAGQNGDGIDFKPIRHDCEMAVSKISQKLMRVVPVRARMAIWTGEKQTIQSYNLLTWGKTVTKGRSILHRLLSVVCFEEALAAIALDRSINRCHCTPPTFFRDSNPSCKCIDQAAFLVACREKVARETGTTPVWHET